MQNGLYLEQLLASIHQGISERHLSYVHNPPNLKLDFGYKFFLQINPTKLRKGILVMLSKTVYTN